jgi:hypothetical protein
VSASLLFLLSFDSAAIVRIHLYVHQSYPCSGFRLSSETYVSSSISDSYCLIVSDTR